MNVTSPAILLSRTPRWSLIILSSLPALCVVATIFYYFWNTALVSDGVTYWSCAPNVWKLPLMRENFRCVDHDSSYVGMGIIGAAHLIGGGSLDVLRAVMMACFAIAIIAFARLSWFVLPNPRYREVSLVSLLFALTPAIGVYAIALGLDLFVVMFLLVTLNAIASRRLLLSAVFGVGLAFSKETGFVLYTGALPFTVWYFMLGGARTRARWTSMALLLVPVILEAINIWSKVSLAQYVTASGYCAPTLREFAFNTNLRTPNIQNYLFNLFFLNFQWLLLIPLVFLLFRPRACIQSCRRPNAAVVLVIGFLLSAVYTFTRCPVWNNIKYIIMAVPLPLLLSYSCAQVVWPRAWFRMMFFSFIAVVLGASSIRSFDPVSKQFYGETPFGNGQMYCMASRTRKAYEGEFCGLDEMIYSLQRLVFERKE